MMDMGFWPDVRRIVSTLPGRTPADAALLGDDARRGDEAGGRARARRRSTCRLDRRAARRGASRTPSRPSVAQKTEWLARFLRRTEGPMLVFVRTKHGADRLARKLQWLRRARRGAARRSHAAAADRGGRRLPQRPVSRARGDRCRGARPRHRRHHARRELRSAVVAGNLCAPRGSDGSRCGDRHRAHARRARRAPRARSAAAILRTGIARMMDDPNPFGPEPQPPGGRHAGGRASCVGSRAVAGRREVPLVPLARHAGTGGVLHPPRRAAVCRQGRLQSRFVVPGVQLLQAAADAEEEGTVRVHVLTQSSMQMSMVRRLKSFLHSTFLPLVHWLDLYSENSFASSTHSPFGARS